MTRRTRPRGYTVVELMMSLAVLAIGVSGVIAMQKVTLASNQHAKNLAVATGIAEAWADALAADGTQWNSTSDLGQTEWLKLVGDSALPWVRPAYAVGRDFGAGFSPLGNPVSDANIALAQFCTDLRLTWIHPQDQFPGSGLVRAEIRVFWRRDNAVAGDVPGNFCSAAANVPSSVTANPGAYHFVFLTTAISQQVGT